MNNFFQKFIIAGVIVNVIATIAIISFISINTARAEVPGPPIGPLDPQPPSEKEAEIICRQWFDKQDFSDYSQAEIIALRIELYAKCLEDPHGFVSSTQKDFDKNVIKRRGKHFFPTAAPYAPNFPAIPGTEAIDPSEGIPQLVAFVYLVGLWLVGAVVFIQITAGGVKWLLAAGRPGEIEKAKTQITNAILGLILLLSSYVILSTINPDLVNSIFETPLIGTGGLPH